MKHTRETALELLRELADDLRRENTEEARQLLAECENLADYEIDELVERLNGVPEEPETNETYLKLRDEYIERRLRELRQAGRPIIPPGKQT